MIIFTTLLENAWVVVETVNSFKKDTKKWIGSEEVKETL